MTEGHLFAVLRLPCPWPPDADVVLFKRQHGNTFVKLTADAQGRFGFEVSLDAGAKTYLFQPIAVEGTGPTLLEVSWSSEAANLSFDGREVLLDQKAHGAPFMLKTKDD